MNKFLAILFLAFAVITTAHAESYTFSNTSEIDVPEYNHHGWWSTGGTADDVVSSSIDISGTTGTITDLNVTLDGVTSKAFVDMVLVLVGPNDTAVVLAANAGGANENSYVPTVDITFDDEADSQIAVSNSFNEAQNENKNLEEGSYQLSDYDIQPYYLRTGEYAVVDPIAEGFFGDPDNFADENLLSAFDDISANGTWTLLAFDNYATDATVIEGWTLSFETTGSGSTGAVPEPAEWALMILAALGLTAVKFYRKGSLAR